MSIAQPQPQWAESAAAMPAISVDGPAAVSIERLTLRFGDGPTILDGLDLVIEAGSRVAVIGANGAGKSTLVRSLIRLVEPASGQITVLGSPIIGLDRRRLAKIRARVGFVFQKHNLVPRLSALTNVVHGVQSRQSGPRTWHQALAKRAVRDEALHCLDKVGLADRALSRVDRLSGGQSQRVAVARMLMQRPQLVIADEPDASLDPKAGEEVMALLADLTAEQKATLIFVSHRMEHAIRFSDRIVGLANGGLALDTPSAMANSRELEAFFRHD